MPKIQTLIIPGTLPDLNAIVNDAKTHWSGYSRVKKKYTNYVALLCRQQGIQPVKALDLEIVWLCPDRMKDKDNIAAGGKKVILDGLVKAGIIPNDGWRNVGELRDCGWAVDKVNPRIMVAIIERDKEFPQSRRINEMINKLNKVKE